MHHGSFDPDQSLPPTTRTTAARCWDCVCSVYRAPALARELYCLCLRGSSLAAVARVGEASHERAVRGARVAVAGALTQVLHGMHVATQLHAVHHLEVADALLRVPEHESRRTRLARLGERRVLEWWNTLHTATRTVRTRLILLASWESVVARTRDLSLRDDEHVKAGIVAALFGVAVSRGRNTLAILV